MLRRVSFFAVLAAALLMLVPESFAQGQGRGQRGQGRDRGGQGGGRDRGGQRGGGFGGQRGGFSGRGFGGRGGAGGTSKMQLVGNRQVQDEVEMTDAQKSEVRAALTAYIDEQRKAIEDLGIDFAAMRDMNDEERKAVQEKMTKARAEVEKSSWTVLALTLKDEQVERIEQIELQLAGINGLVMESTAKELALKDEQVKEIKKAIEDLSAARNKMREEIMAQFGFGGGNRGGGRPGGGERPEGGRRPGGEGADRGQRGAGGPGAGGLGGGRGGFDREAMTKKNEEIQANAMKTAVAVLTDDQKKKYEEMKGEKFEFQRNQGRGGFGGGRGGFGGGQGRGGFGGGRGGQGGPGGGRPQRPGGDDDA